MRNYILWCGRIRMDVFTFAAPSITFPPDPWQTLPKINEPLCLASMPSQLKWQQPPPPPPTVKTKNAVDGWKSRCGCCVTLLRYGCFLLCQHLRRVFCGRPCQDDRAALGCQAMLVCQVVNAMTMKCTGLCRAGGVEAPVVDLLRAYLLLC